MNCFNNYDDTQNRRHNESADFKDIGCQLSAIPGTTITFDLLDHESNETDRYTLKLVEHSKFTDNEISLDSPTGKYIKNSHVGDVIPYELKSNKFTITVIDIK